MYFFVSAMRPIFPRPRLPNRATRKQKIPPAKHPRRRGRHRGISFDGTAIQSKAGRRRVVPRPAPRPYHPHPSHRYAPQPTVTSMLRHTVNPRKEVTMTQTPKTGKTGKKITTKGTTLKRTVKKNYPKLKGT